MALKFSMKGTAMVQYPPGYSVCEMCKRPYKSKGDDTECQDCADYLDDERTGHAKIQIYGSDCID